MKKLICLILFTFLFSNLSAQEDQKEEVIEIDIIHLLAEFKTNIIRAEMLYLGKRIKVTGLVTGIERNCVTMIDTRIYFKPSETKKIAQLNKRQFATFNGILEEYYDNLETLFIKDAILISD